MKPNEMPYNSSQKWLWAWVIAILVVPITGFQSLLEPFGRDQGIHATIAYALSKGLLTYSDVYNIKPPLTTAAHWVSQALFGHSMMSIRILDMCAVAAVAVGLVEVVRRAGYDILFGVAAPVAFTIIYYSYDYWTHSQTDGWAGFLVVGAVISMQSGWAKTAGPSRHVRMFLAGLILGLAFSFKYTIGGTGLLIFAPLLARQKFYWSDFFFCVLGGALVLAVIVGVLMLAGAFLSFLEIQSYISGYLSYDSVLPSFWAEIRLPGIAFDTVFYAVVLGFVVLVTSVKRGRSPLLPASCILWVFSAWLSGNVQGKGFFYHYLPLVPVYGLLASASVYGLAQCVQRRSIQWLIVVTLIAAGWISSPAWDASRAGLAAIRTSDPISNVRASVDGGGDYGIDDAVAFADLLRARRNPDDGLFVWGYETVLYFLVEEPPRYRYPYAWPFVVDFYDDRYTHDLLERLQAAPPRHFVVQKNDATPWVTGRPESSAEVLLEISPLKSFLEDGYSLVLSTARFDLFERTENSE